RVAVLERALLLMNDLPGQRVEGVLAPAAATPGASELVITAREKPHETFFQIDNRGSRYLGPLQAQTALRLNNRFGLYEALDVQLVTAPDGFPHRELDYGGISWQQPLGARGAMARLGGSITSTDPGDRLAAFDIKGLARAWHAGL